ncbi:CapA family protein [Candidatus Saccharibacteria bacterium]|nr:CapA family protein [Candidatus Saccharibacteria bacterium]
MRSFSKSHSGKKVWLVVAVSIIVLAGIVGASYMIIHAQKPTAAKTETAKIEVKTPKTTLISSTDLFLGNTYWGRYINDWAMASSLKYAYPFSRLNEFQRDKYDAWISGLECPTAAGVHMTSAQEDETLTFNCSPDYLPEAAKWFTAFTLANNHTDNQGVDGFSETKTALEINGIQHFGHYDPRSIDDICEVIALPVTVTQDNQTTKSGSLPVAMCGYHGVFRIPTQEAVDQMKKYADYMPVIAMPHMGAEYKAAPDDLKINFYRSLIDGGADMVLGDHPHWIQTSESYRGHLIVYSMGNFIFDQQDTAEVVRSAGVKVVIQTTDTDSILLDKWLLIGDLCKAFKDNCLEQIKNQNLKKLDFKYQFSIIGTNDADKIVKPATAVQQAAILNRLNWSETIKQLQSPYSGL